MRRFRRLRSNESIRSLVRETRVDKKDLIYPIFVDQEEGENHHDHLEIEESRFGIDEGREVKLAEHGRHAVGKRDGTP